MNGQKHLQPENSSDRRKTYTVQEIAGFLGISIRSAYNLCESTVEFKVMRIGRSVRVNKQSFDHWFDCDMAD